MAIKLNKELLNKMVEYLEILKEELKEEEKYREENNWDSMFNEFDEDNTRNNLIDFVNDLTDQKFEKTSITTNYLYNFLVELYK